MSEIRKIRRLNDYDEVCIGTIVVLTHPLYYYGIGESNPLLGSKYATVGEVTESHADASVSVRWSNGNVNFYKKSTLSEVIYTGNIHCREDRGENTDEKHMRSIWEDI